MSDALTLSAKSPAIVPVPRVAISVRLATPADIPFIDDLQKKHQKMLGWTPRKTIEGKIAAGHLLVAESSDLTRLGYCISQDRYMGRDDCGVIYQMNVAPVEQRKLIGATLVKTIFERAAYGCRLFCCWCAQDIAANYFWESMGFVPLAFRAGNRAKARVHIFWQRRIRERDTTTPYWFPAETRGGMMNEARLVLPIPPGTHWKDAKPIILPAQSGVEGPGAQENVALPAPKAKSVSKEKLKRPAPAQDIRGKLTLRGISFSAPKPPEPPASVKPKREPRPKAKNDPKLVAAARELRDRWMEEINAGRYLPEANGKYEVARQIAEVSTSTSLSAGDQRTSVSLESSALPLLPAA